MKMKKIGVVAVTLLMALTLNINSALAANLEYATSGWSSVGENEVQLKTEVLDIQTAQNQNGITLPTGFSVRTNKKYNAATKEEDKASGAMSYESIGGLAITYDEILEPGTHTIPGTIKLKWKNAAVLNDKTLCDVTMTIDNIKVKNMRNTQMPIAVLLSEKGTGIQAAIFYSRYIDNYSEDIGASYDISFRITKAGTDENINKNMGFAFQDMDISDRLNSSSYVNTDGTVSEYVEGVTLISGIKDKIYLDNNHLLKISDTEYGKNTDFSGTQNVDNIINGKDNIEEMRRAGLITLVDSNGFKFKWHGSACRTGIAGIELSKVITSTSGKYPDKVTISQTDNEVLWKENKQIKIVPDKGYHVTKITIDEIEISYDLLELKDGKREYKNGNITYTFTEDKNGNVTYTFNDVITDHKIDVAVEPNNYIIHYDAGGGEGTMDDTIAEYDEKDNLSKNEFTKDGYEFIGWKAYYEDENGELAELKDENGKVMTFKDKDEFINLVGKNNEEVTLVAQWKSPLIVNVPKTGINTPLFITLMGISLIAFAIFIKRYVY